MAKQTQTNGHTEETNNQLAAVLASFQGRLDKIDEALANRSEPERLVTVGKGGKILSARKPTAKPKPQRNVEITIAQTHKGNLSVQAGRGRLFIASPDVWKRIVAELVPALESPESVPFFDAVE